MTKLYFIANNGLHVCEYNKTAAIPCQAIDQYKKNLDEIRQRKEWKMKGTGAQFMGANRFDSEDGYGRAFTTDAVILDPQNIIYSARLDDGTAINVKPTLNLQETEGLILRKNDFITHDIALDTFKKRLILSVQEQQGYATHLCILPLDSNHLQFITEGECLDANPFFDPNKADQVYYDSCGLAVGQNGISYGPREICHLDLSTGELQTVLADQKYDFFRPQVDLQGNLYFIQRPYLMSGHTTSPLGFLLDILQAPFKIIRAIVGWLDFFTQRYTGESLKTSSGKTTGQNPAVDRNMSEEELFVEGNLIKAQKNLEANAKQGQKFPGTIPDSWQVVKRLPTGELELIKKGVMSFRVKNDVIYYSNGKHLIALKPDKTEEKMTDARLISKII
nr:hypothetical protein [Acinetobacter sp. Marseille-Q1620]